MRTKAGNFVVVPNSVLAKDTITNYSEPTRSVRLQVEVGASYDVAPNVVKGAIGEALRDVPGISRERDVEVLLAEFAASSVTYRVRFWIADFEADERMKDAVRSRIYYALRRHNIAIPYPVQVELSAEQGGLAQAAATIDDQALRTVPMFVQLTDGERAELLRQARPVLFCAGEIIVRQGAAGRSLFVLTKGEAAVRLEGSDGDVARLHAGDVFGEMSLLTGDPRTATVMAEADCELLEIDAEGFRRVVQANPTVLERITAAISARRRELEQHRDAHAPAPPAAEGRQSLLDRVRDFLHL
jgi:CRP-like cAMP-binding protein